MDVIKLLQTFDCRLIQQREKCSTQMQRPQNIGLKQRIRRDSSHAGVEYFTFNLTIRNNIWPVSFLLTRSRRHALL